MRICRICSCQNNALIAQKVTNELEIKNTDLKVLEA